MKLFQKLLAVSLTAVLTLSALTGCGNNSPSLLSALNSMGKPDGIAFKSGTAEKGMAQAAAKTLTNATLLDLDEGGRADPTEFDAALATLGISINRAIAAAEYVTDGDYLLWMVCIKTKDMDSVAQASAIYSSKSEMGDPITYDEHVIYLTAYPQNFSEFTELSSTVRIGTATFKNAAGESYCLAIITADAVDVT